MLAAGSGGRQANRRSAMRSGVTSTIVKPFFSTGGSSCSTSRRDDGCALAPR